MDLTKQPLLAGKYIIGIDPAKKKHQAVPTCAYRLFLLFVLL